MKKIGIYTLHDSKNFGAYLQAFAISRFLINDCGCKPYFVKSYSSFSSKKSILKILKNPGKEIYKFRLNLKYRKCINNFEIIFPKDNKYKKLDMFILGSDEIWNLKNPYFEHISEFFGKNIKNKKVISYAPSVNETTKEHILKKYGQTAFDSIDAISVRDSETKKIVEEISHKKVKEVVDPTFLIENYDKYTKPIKANKYLLIYGYSFSSPEIRNIKEFAKNNNLKIYSIGQYQKWCHINIVADPFDFLSYIKNADYVITKTLHGTIFSIIFRKQFGVYCNNSIKIKCLLGKNNLKSVILDDEKDISLILNKQINYNKIFEKLLKDIKSSKDFIIKNI